MALPVPNHDNHDERKSLDAHSDSSHDISEPVDKSNHSTGGTSLPKSEKTSPETKPDIQHNLQPHVNRNRGQQAKGAGKAAAAKSQQEINKIYGIDAQQAQNVDPMKSAIAGKNKNSHGHVSPTDNSNIANARENNTHHNVDSSTNVDKPIADNHASPVSLPHNAHDSVDKDAIKDSNTPSQHDASQHNVPFKSSSHASNPEPQHESKPASSPNSNHGGTPSPKNASKTGSPSPQSASSKPLSNPLNKTAKTLANATNNLGKNIGARSMNKVSSMARKTSEMAKQVALKVKNTGIAVWNFISSPVGWISILLVISIMLVSTILQTYGNGGITCNNSDSPTDSSTGSSSSSGSSSTLSGGVNWNADAQTVAKTFQKAGYSKAATAAALGNFMQESGVSASAYNGSSGATGLGQWLGGRLTNMKSHATAMGKDWHSMDAQADYAVNVEVPPPGGWGTGLASWIKSKYSDQTMTAQGLWQTWASAGSDDASLNKSVFMWMAGWERPGPSESNLENREAKAKAYLAQLNTLGGTWAADGTTPAGKSPSGSSDDSNSSSSSDQAQCLLKDNDVTTSSTTGTFPTNTNNFGWMCNEAKVCKSGDWGPLGAISGSSNPGGYQCVWYAWTRLWMIHGKNVATLAPYSGNGGDIWESLQGKAGWQVDTTPHAGDGLSGHNFGGSTGSAGHVAAVEKVDADPSGWKITISEGNFSSDGGWNGYHGGRTFTKAQLAGTDVHFFRNTAWSTTK